MHVSVEKTKKNQSLLEDFKQDVRLDINERSLIYHLAVEQMTTNFLKRNYKQFE